MASPQRRPSSEETRAALLDAAASVFIERGLHGATIREIARRAGYTNPVLYYHFGGKDDLYDAVIREAFERFRALLGQALASEVGADPRARLRAVAVAYLRFGQDAPVALRMLYAELFRPRGARPDPRFDEIRSWAVAQIEGVLREAADAGMLPVTDVPLARRLFVAVLGGLLVEQARDPKVRLLEEALADTVVAFFLQGLSALPVAS